ncbi:hypothetical protein FKM82_020549 [Ascaphus truei]
MKLHSIALSQVNTRIATRKENEMWDIRLHALANVLVIVLVDVYFHFLYILTIPSDVKLVNRLSDWSLGV